MCRLCDLAICEESSDESKEGYIPLIPYLHENMPCCVSVTLVVSKILECNTTLAMLGGIVKLDLFHRR